MIFLSYRTAITSSLRSVMSSIEYRSPSRPRPESFTPPYGIWSTRKLGTSPAITPPTSSSSNAIWMSPASRVNTPACSP